MNSTSVHAKPPQATKVTATTTTTTTKTTALHKIKLPILLILVGLLASKLHELQSEIVTVSSINSSSYKTTTTTTLSHKEDEETRILEQLPNHNLNRRTEIGSWIADQWVPPSHWDYYSAADLQNLYADTRVLWIGDSTGRRSFTTLYGILNSTTNDSQSPTPIDVVPGHAIDHSRVIDVNKARVTEPCQFLENNPENWGSVNVTNKVRLCRTNPSSTHTRTNATAAANPLPSFIYKDESCIGGLQNFLLSEVSGESNVTAGVDLIVISLGIWEAIRPWDCRTVGKENMTVFEKQADAIDLLDQLLDQRVALAVSTNTTARSRHRPTVVWRTTGFDKRGIKTDHLSELNTAVMDEIDKRHVMSLVPTSTTMSENNSAAGVSSSSSFPSANDIKTQVQQHQHQRKQNSLDRGFLTYVNWGGAMYPKSFGDDRIDGDLKPHYGLAARLALVQMVTNAWQQKQQLKV